MEHLFAVQSATSSVDNLWIEAGRLRQKLTQWGEELPECHKLRTQEDVQKATPHALALHMQWECAKIVLHLPL